MQKGQPSNHSLVQVLLQGRLYRCLHHGRRHRADAGKVTSPWSHLNKDYITALLVTDARTRRCGPTAAQITVINSDAWRESRGQKSGVPALNNKDALGGGTRSVSRFTSISPGVAAARGRIRADGHLWVVGRTDDIRSENGRNRRTDQSGGRRSTIFLLRLFLSSLCYLPNPYRANKAMSSSSLSAAPYNAQWRRIIRLPRPPFSSFPTQARGRRPHDLGYITVRRPWGHR